MIGQTLGPYRIDTEVARGGQATLYKATHIVLRRETALKVLHTHLITVSDFVQKFEAESRLLARLRHPNIVAVHDAGIDQGRYWIAMEWLDGDTVDDLIATHGKLAVDQAVRIAEQVATALEYAHGLGLIHRDIKPSNLMVLRDGTAKVLDFGIATILAAGQKAVTRIGTVEYMSPEQFAGQADLRSDLYSLGATLYYMLTGQTAPTLAAYPVMPPRQLNPAVPTRLEGFLSRALAHDPGARPHTASAFRAEMQSSLAAPAVASNAGIQCPKCHTDNRIAAQYCRRCGQALSRPLQVGSGPLRVVSQTLVAREQDFQPQFAWSPDGSKFAFLSNATAPSFPSGAQLYVLDCGVFQDFNDMLHLRRHRLDRNIPKVKLGDPRMNWWSSLEPVATDVDAMCVPTWSPDGRKVAYVANQDSKIWAWSDDQLNRQLTWEHNTRDTDPQWSLDGTKLLYTAKIEIDTYWSPQWQLMDIATKRIYQTADAHRCFVSADGNSLILASDWGIVVHDRDDNVIGYSECPFQAGLRKVKSLGAGMFIASYEWTHLVSHPGDALILHDTLSCSSQQLLVESDRIGDFVISPNQNWVVAAISEVTQTLAMESTLVLVPLTGGSPFRLRAPRSTTSNVKPLDWSPDSAKLLFTRSNEIWVVNRNDTGIQSLAKGHFAQWSPDGQHIAYMTTPQQDTHELWVMRIEAA